MSQLGTIYKAINKLKSAGQWISGRPEKEEKMVIVMRDASKRGNENCNYI